MNRAWNPDVFLPIGEVRPQLHYDQLLSLPESVPQFLRGVRDLSSKRRNRRRSNHFHRSQPARRTDRINALVFPNAARQPTTRSTSVRKPYRHRRPCHALQTPRTLSAPGAYS